MSEPFDQRETPPYVEWPPPQLAPPKDHLALALVGACACAPTGVVAIWWATKVESAWLQGDVDRANHASTKAKNWGVASLFLLPLMLVPCLLLAT
jgi:hypothetical protein